MDDVDDNKDGQDDLAIMAPDMEVTIAGRTITVREYRFLDGLRVRARARALTKDLAALVAAGDTITEDIIDVLAKHEALVRVLIMESIGDGDTTWMDGLGAIDGQELIMTWWAVNGPFFVRQVAARLVEQGLAKKAFGGATLPPSSPSAATATPPNSGANTPSGS
jgi:hypothetical protein